MVQINARNLNHVVLAEEPTQCPICLHSIAPVRLMANVWQFMGGKKHAEKVDVSYICPNNGCGRMFVGRFERGMYDERSTLVHRDSQPKVVQPPVIESEILEVSSDFGDIYTQAFVAESHSLNGIAGVGYRKAIEFLIKDYCIKKDPESEDVIKRKFLGVVIRDHVDDANVKKCATLAVWLGNDETHYERKFNDKDIEDLKILIRLTCNWITNEILTNRYASEMAPK